MKVKRFVTLFLIGFALLAVPQQRAEAHGGFRGFNRNVFFNGFFGGYGFGGYGFGGYGFSSFAYATPIVTVAYVPTVAVAAPVVNVATPAYSAPAVAAVPAYSAPAVALLPAAQVVYSLPVFQQVYAAQTVYTSPFAFANACYGNSVLFNAHFGRFGHRR